MLYERGVVALTVRPAEDRARAAPGVSDLWARAVPRTVQVVTNGIVCDLVAVQVRVNVAVEHEVLRDGSTEDTDKTRL